MTKRSIEDVRAAIVDVPDFPEEGIVFKDITPVLDDPELFKAVTTAFKKNFGPHEPDYVVGIESRGFILGAALAHALDVGFVPVRKPGKLPRKVLSETYALEYGTDTLELHEDAFANATKVVILDDVLATGGTAHAALRLCRKAGAEVAGLGFLMELGFLEGRGKLEGVPITSLITY